MAEDLPPPYQQSPLPVANQPWWKTKVVALLALAVLLLVLGLATVGLLSTIANRSASTHPSPTPSPLVSTTPTSTATVSGTLTPTPTPTTTSLSFNVYFSKHPDSDAHFDQVFAVKRTATTTGVAREAFINLLQGPTSSEQSSQLFSSWTTTGASTCGADGFTITIAAGKATITLCKDFSSAGVGQDARAQAEADATLKQFSTITTTIYLNKNGDCLFDQSGQNACLK